MVARVLAGALLLVVLLPGFQAHGQTYPTRPIKLIVPFPAGGPLVLKQTFVIENRSGAGGNIGTEAAAKAAPDGYTLLIVLGTTLTVNPGLYAKLPFDPNADLVPISILTGSSQMLVVHPSVPVNSVAEFVAYAKKEPVSYAHAGHGSPGHLAMEYFRLRAGFQANPVPYRGNAPLVNDLVAGQIPAGFVASAGVMPHVHAGRLKGLAVSATKRSQLAPDVPTVAESGYPGFEVDTYFVLLAPAGTPAPILELLEREVRQAVKAPDLQEKFRAQDLVPIASSAAEAKARLKADTERWAQVIKAANMKAE
jgi:tripartite-type tricarboxylate transporter receptor subunit TctC